MPQTFSDWCKEILWTLLRPFWPPLRWILRTIGMRPFGPRQRSHLGWLAPGKTPAEFRTFLKSIGFRHDPFAWVDDDEVFGLRNCFTFKYQQHVRLYRDGEVRGHQEITPEYDDLTHVRDQGRNTGDLMVVLEDWLIQKKPGP